MAARYAIDVVDLAKRVTTPAIVLHAVGDAAIPFEQGRQLAALIPGAKLVPLESDNHVLLDGEPAWEAFLAEVRAFLGAVAPEPIRHVGELSKREADVLTLVAAGHSNEEIAERLFLSVRTVERHLSNVYVKFGLSGKSARAAAAAEFARRSPVVSA
jgi:DNA-binding NarL/FixJ family response regulator